MKKYYKNFLKSFNLIHVILLGLFLVGVCYLGENYSIIQSPASSTILFKNNLILGALYSFMPLASLVGFNSLKNKKLTGLDLLRNGLLLGTIGSTVCMSLSVFSITKCVILCLSLVCLVIQIIVRTKYISEDSSVELGFRNYVCSLVSKFNLLTIVLLGSVLGAVGIILLGNIDIALSFSEYYPGVLVSVCVLSAVVLPITSKDDANMVDVLMIAFAIASLVVCSYSIVDLSIKSKTLILAVLLLGCVYARGLNYSGNASSSFLKVNNYYKDLFTKYDIVLPFVLASVISVNILGDNIVYPIVSTSVGVVLLAGLLIFNKFKSKEITLSDYFLSAITISSIMLVPVVLSIDYVLQQHILYLVAVIVNACLLVVALAFNLVRVKAYGVLEEVQEAVLEEETVVVEVPVVEEVVVEETKEEVIVEQEQEVQEKVFEDDDSLEEEDEETSEDETDEEETQDEGSVLLSIDNVNGLAGNKNVKRKFNTKLMLASDDAKYYYSEIKNYLQMYRANGRYSSRCETYRYKGIVAKVALAGKSIKVYLALDPSQVDANRYNFKDASEKKQYKDVPVMVKVKSARGLKYFKELVDMMMASRDVKPKRKYEPVDYTISLIPNGEAIFTELGVGDDYIYDTIHVKNIPSDLPDELGKFLPNIQGEKIEGDIVYATIHLDTLCNHFNDGDIIDMTVLKNLNLINRGNALRIKARGTLDRKLVIFADDFDSDAVKMILCTNGTAVKVER